MPGISPLALLRGVRRAYHGTSSPLRGEVLDPILAAPPEHLSAKPRLATMLGLHAAADPRVAEQVARERAIEDLRRYWTGWNPPEQGAPWEDIAAFADRTGRPDKYNPVIYPLRIEGNVRRVPQTYQGDASRGYRPAGYEHDDWAVARDIIRNTMDRPTFVEMMRPRYNLDRSEAEGLWDVLSRTRPLRSTDPWIVQEGFRRGADKKYMSSPIEFAIDSDSGLFSLTPERRIDLVRAYQDKMKGRGFGALSYINTGANKEVPDNANPWSYIIFPGNARWLGKRRGGRVRYAI